MPHPFELPWMRRAVVPLVSARDSVIGEFIVNGLPRLSAVIRPLDQLPVPPRGLRRVQTIRVSGRSLQVINLPTGKMGAADVPFLPFRIRRQNERTLASANQYPYATHLVCNYA